MILSVVLVTSLTAGIATSADLRGKRIATIGRLSASTQWARFYKARVSEVSELNDAITLLEDDRVDGVLASRHGLEHYLHINQRSPFKLASFDIASAYVGIALPRDSALTPTLNEIILQLHTQIRFQEIRNNWQTYIEVSPPADAVLIAPGSNE